MAFLAPAIHNTACAAANHLLAASPELAVLLSQHAGHSLHLTLPPLGEISYLEKLPLTLRGIVTAGLSKLNLPPLVLAFDITPEQTLVPHFGELPPEDATVAVAVQSGFLAAGATEKLRFVRLQGDAYLAQTLATLAQHLRWDAEHDLAKVVGDAAAVRVLQGVKDAAQAVQDLAQRLRANVQEYKHYEKS